MIAWGMGGKIVGAVQCCIVCHGCTQLWAHKYGQFLQMFCVTLGLYISFWAFCVFLLLDRAIYSFCVFFGVFCFVCFVLSVPVQVIAWKDSPPKWPIMCRAGCKTLLTHLVCLAVQCTEVHAACRAEADGEYADAMGTDPWRASSLSHHWSYHICEWDSMGHWARLHFTMGVCVYQRVCSFSMFQY